eukprot:1667712-Prymnesium_polylepis.1
MVEHVVVWEALRKDCGHASEERMSAHRCVDTCVGDENKCACLCRVLPLVIDSKANERERVRDVPCRDLPRQLTVREQPSHPEDGGERQHSRAKVKRGRLVERRAVGALREHGE